MMTVMDDARARKTLSAVLEVIDAWGDLYDRRWGRHHPYDEDPTLDRQVANGRDKVRTRTRLARDIVAAMPDPEIATKIREHDEGAYGGHPFTQARIAVVEAIAILSQREELAAIVGPVGPQLSASEFHQAVWGAAATLWDNGHFRQAVQTAASALEGMLQAIAGPGLSGENLAILFSLSPPGQDAARLRIRDIDPESKTYKSAHEGAAALVRGAFLAVRNLVSHPGWPDPNYTEGLEMISVLSLVAHLLERSDVVQSAPGL